MAGFQAVVLAGPDSLLGLKSDLPLILGSKLEGQQLYREHSLSWHRYRRANLTTQAHFQLLLEPYLLIF